MTQTEIPVAPAPVMLASVGQVQLELKLIKLHAEAGNFAHATRVERRMWEGVLEAVAASNAQAGWLAAEALKSKEIDFPRC